jgi:hypothetical protein
MQVMGLLAGLALMCGGVGCIFYANALTDRVLSEVNAVSSVKDRISPVWIHANLGRIWSRHKALFPESPKRDKSTRLQFLGLALILIGGVLFVETLFG